MSTRAEILRALNDGDAEPDSDSKLIDLESLNILARIRKPYDRAIIEVYESEGRRYLVLGWRLRDLLDYGTAADAARLNSLCISVHPDHNEEDEAAPLVLWLDEDSAMWFDAQEELSLIHI